MANRKNTFLLKRSNVAGKVPAAGDLQLGELALNTADVIAYASGTTANSIIPIGWDRIARTGDTMTGQLITPSISATTYYNLPLDVFVTGGTYSSQTLTLTRNDNNSITITGFSSSSSSSLNYGEIFIGDSGNTAQSFAMTGDVLIDATGKTTIQNGVVTYAKMQTASQPSLLGSTSSGGTIQEIPTIEAYIGSGSTAASLLDDANNWNQYGVYTGTTISGTFLGQNHYNDNYWYTAVQDNVWIRLIRG